jgi:DNA-binding Lrp family transcriptional regulator
LKPAELRLLSELMKDSQRSDRELAKALGVSQPTVSRMRVRLEKEKVIKEYTMIPDFHKLGFEILAITFLALDKEPDSQHERTLSTFQNVLTFERGLGLKYSHVVVSLHETYSSYAEFERKLKDSLIATSSASFLVNLNDGYSFFSFLALAKELESARTLILLGDTSQYMISVQDSFLLASTATTYEAKFAYGLCFITTRRFFT